VDKDNWIEGTCDMSYTMYSTLCSISNWTRL